LLRGKKAPSSKLWTALFPANTYVQPYQFDDHSGEFVYSYPVQNVLSYIKSRYQLVGATTRGQHLANLDVLEEFLDTHLTDPEIALLDNIAGLKNRTTSHRVRPTWVKTFSRRGGFTGSHTTCPGRRSRYRRSTFIRPSPR
jgi:hypothetical protein